MCSIATCDLRFDLITPHEKISGLAQQGMGSDPKLPFLKNIDRGILGCRKSF